ncbi:MAG: bifunctional folylpolyglutamate synthase/dihydrofolate synthase [Cyclobacteriaceae bacterium]
MNYQEAIDFLYTTLPMFQRVGKVAYKKDLTNTLAFCRELDHPECKFRSVHIAGTNGKGSSAHSIAAILQAAGYKTGLYTSPHLKDFGERIRINGQQISREAVTEFVNRQRDFINELKPSFFETTVAMAFDYFAKEAVDIAVIEVGMGGRLDSTNVISPLVSLITHIGYDHMEFLGDTLEKIAAEKAGIIKTEVPVVIGEKQAACAHVFENFARERQAPLFFAQDAYRVELSQVIEGKYHVNIYQQEKLLFKDLALSLGAHYQLRNLPGILAAVDQLIKAGFEISQDNIRQGLSQVIELTGLKGRWQVLRKKPLTICDTGHNEGAIREITFQLQQLSYSQLYMVLGLSVEKDLSKILPLLPKDAFYFFCQAAIPRALDAQLLAQEAKAYGLQGEVVPQLNKAYAQALAQAKENDCIFVGGSTFVVAELDDL